MQSQIIKYIEKVPALSPTIAKIVEITNNMNSSASDLVTAIKLDPMLTAKILNLINSAFFGMSEKVTSINRAIILLGMNTIKNLALSAEVLSSFNPGAGGSFSVEKFWEHSLATAVCCKLLAKRLIRDPNKIEEYFIAGLIHDIGKIFLIKYFGGEYFSMIQRDGEYKKILPREKKIFTMDHAEIGGLIAEKWALSPELASSIRDHHVRRTPPNAAVMSAAVYFANIHAKVSGYDDMIGLTLPPEPDDADWEYLKIPAAEGETLFVSLQQLVDEAKIFLQLRG
jgi:HD-like signal output (HDOD) protein